jgi:hypothetical protein
VSFCGKDYESLYADASAVSQVTRHILRSSPQKNSCRLGGQDEETGRKTVRHCEMVERRRCCAEGDGTSSVQRSALILEINSIGHQNITAFLMDQNQQFQDTVYGLNYAKESLDPARSELSGKPRCQRCSSMQAPKPRPPYVPGCSDDWYIPPTTERHQGLSVSRSHRAPYIR